MEVFNIPPSKQVGDLKNAIKDAILDGIIPNNYAAAYEYMVQKAKEIKLEPVKNG